MKRSKDLDWDEAPLDVVLWCVYGPECFPTVFACKVKNHPDSGRTIWGFSVYRRQRGFRTLGTGKEWMLRNDALLFATQADAFSYISGLFPASEP